MYPTQETNSLPPESNLNQLIGDFDSADLTLRMAYGSFLEKPHKAHETAVNTGQLELYEQFGELLRFISDSPDALDLEDKPEAIASLIASTVQQHIALLSDYIDTIAPQPDEDREASVQQISSYLRAIDESETSIEAEALDYLMVIFNKDTEALEAYKQKYDASPKRIMRERIVRGSAEMAKVGGGVLAALLIRDLLKRA